MEDNFEHDGNFDVLQNIEFAIVSALENHPEMDDNDAMSAMDAVIKDFRDMGRGRTPKPHTFSGATQTVFDRVQEVCLWRVGKGPAPGYADEEESDAPDPEPLTVEALLQCLKKIRKSMDRHHDGGGYRGYLMFVVQYFMPDAGDGGQHYHDHHGDHCDCC